MRIQSKYLVSLGSMVCLLAAAACATSDPDKGGPNGDKDGGKDGDKDGGSPDPTPPASGKFVYPQTVYTGVDGTHAFKVPVTSDLPGVTWSIEDPSIATIEKTAQPSDYGNRCDIGGEWAMLTPKKAGTTKIIAKSAEGTATAVLVIQSYNAAAYNAGNARYNTPDNATAAQRAACASCHLKANGVDHSPFATAGYADDDILSAITTGVYKHGYQLTGVNHAWNLTDAEKQGILPYLRSLRPHGF